MSEDKTSSKDAMTPVARGIISPAAIRGALQKINDDLCYDAYTMAIAFVNRCIAKGRHKEASDLCHQFGLEFIKKKRFDLTAGLGTLLIKVLREFELPPTEDNVQLILALFEPRPPSPEDERHRFIEQAIKWATIETSASSEIVLRLHIAAGKSYQADRLYSRAQGHLVFGASGEDLGLLIAEWRKDGYPSEKDLFLLRLVLILLAKKDITLAINTLHSRALSIDLDADVVSPPIQLAYLLTEACLAMNEDFFHTLLSKYSLVIRRDKTFSDHISRIEKDVFGHTPTDTQFNLLNIVSNMFGSGGTGE